MERLAPFWSNIFSKCVLYLVGFQVHLLQIQAHYCKVMALWISHCMFSLYFVKYSPIQKMFQIIASDLLKVCILYHMVTFVQTLVNMVP
jgi:hypothetical protein